MAEIRRTLPAGTPVEICFHDVMRGWAEEQAHLPMGERAMIQSRVKADLQRAQAEQATGKVRRDTQGRRLKAIGRPKISAATETAIKERLAAGVGMLKVAHELCVGSGTVQRVKREMAVAPRR